jgi:hypothetical protein
VAYFVNEQTLLQESVDEFLKEKEVVTFQKGAYSDDIRHVYMALMSKNIGIRLVLSKLFKGHIQRQWQLK